MAHNNDEYKTMLDKATNETFIGHIKTMKEALIVIVKLCRASLGIDALIDWQQKTMQTRNKR